MLNRDGLIEIIPNCGNYVVNLSEKDIIELFQIRAVLEGLIANLVTREIKKGKTGAKILREHLSKFNQLLKTDQAHSLFQFDLDFHDSLVKLSPNDRLKRQVESVKYQTYRTRKMLHKKRESSGSYPIEIKAHILIINTILSGDYEQAERVMRNHIEESLQQILESIIN